MKRIIFITFLFSGCFLYTATKYQPMNWKGGYEETQLDEKTFRVYFKGNGYLSTEKASEMCLLRCSEICLDQGYDYFIIIDEKERITKNYGKTSSKTRYKYNDYDGSVSSKTYGGNSYVISRPSLTNTIVLVNEKGEDNITYNANFLFNSLSRKYIK